MNTLETLSELARAVRDLIRIGVVSDIDTGQALCRVQTGELVTDWLHWLTPRAGGARMWWAPSVGEQVLILSLGGELDTAFVLPLSTVTISPHRLFQRRRITSSFLTVP